MRSVGFNPEDSTAIIHVPPLLPTVINEIYRKRNGGVLARICEIMIGLSETIGKSRVFFKYFTGYCLAVKGTKK